MSQHFSFLTKLRGAVQASGFGKRPLDLEKSEKVGASGADTTQWLWCRHSGCGIVGRSVGVVCLLVFLSMIMSCPVFFFRNSA
jgi:hypothetical protein